MAGAFLFWGAIWAFTGFSGGLLPIFIGLAILMGIKWDADKDNALRDDWWGSGRDDDDDDDDDDGTWDDWTGERRGARSGQGAGDPNHTPSAEAAPVSSPPATEPPTRTPAPAGLHGKVIADAAPARAALASAAAVAAGELGVRLRRMVEATDQITRALETDPGRLSEVQRLYTYYLPSAADLIAARGGLVVAGDAARVAEIDGMIGKLDVAFADFLALMQGRDARSIDIDIRLLEQSLDQEFAHRRKP